MIAIIGRERIIKAREDGYAAGLRGDDPRTCPYDKITIEWLEWQKFHDFAAAVVKHDRTRDTRRCTGF